MSKARVTEKQQDEETWKTLADNRNEWKKIVRSLRSKALKACSVVLYTL